MASVADLIDATAPSRPQPDAAEVRFRSARVEHWDQVALEMDARVSLGGYYHQRLAEIYRFLLPPGLRILEVGCAQGDLLAALEPAAGVGVDFSGQMIQRARQRHPDLTFIHCDIDDLELDPPQPFDAIILSDLVNDLWDVQRTLERLAPLCRPDTRIICNFYSRLWQLPLALAAKLRLAQPNLDQNWLTVEDMDTLFYLAGYETIRSWGEIMWPVRTPLVDRVCNRLLVKLGPIRHLALTNFMIVRPRPAFALPKEKPRVSVIVPARNEEGNVKQIFDRVPAMGAGTELIFIEGHSTDRTRDAIEREIASRTGCTAQLYVQSGKGKGDAVRLGFAKATGDIVMILDADLTVPPEDLPRFYEALTTGAGEFVNGVRLVYPMEEKAMRFLNLVGNKFFSLSFSYLLAQNIRDSLCGTKVMWKRDYERIAANRHYFGDFDPFGDFDLLFGAAKLNLKITDLPVRYRQRSYGETNISRWKHGWLLLRMSIFAAFRIKFV